MRYYMGVDNGGTFIKAVIFDETGMAVAQAHEQIQLITPKPGFTERDMELLWQLNAKAMRAAVEQAGVPPEQIKGVSFSGHGKGLYLWGEGTPAYNGILSTDSRAVAYADKINGGPAADALFKKTVQKALCCQPVALLQWFRDNAPHVLERTKWIFGVKDYIRYRLTGQAFAEITDFSGSNLVNLKTRSYDDEILELLDLSAIKGKLPPLRTSTDICGTVTKEAARQTGLAEGTLCAAGMFDIDASAIAMNIVNEEYLAVIAGTWSINEFIARQPVDDRSVMMNSIYCTPGYYLVEESSPTSASNLEWYMNTFLADLKKRCKERGENAYRLADELVESVAPEDTEAYFLPYIYGSNYNGNAKACFIGLSSYHTQAHVMRAVFEGVTFCHMAHIEKLLAHRPGVKAIRLAGGVTNSEIWSQMFADVTGRKVEIIRTKELGAFGAALCAAVACGGYESMEAAAASLVAVEKSYTPVAACAEIYRKKYERYQRLAQLLEPLWH